LDQKKNPDYFSGLESLITFATRLIKKGKREGRKEAFRSCAGWRGKFIEVL
jgi:hypothetical protein